MRQGRSYWVSLIHFLGGKRRIGVNVRVYNGYRKGIGIQSFSICGCLILLKPYSDKEVRVAFFQMHPSKAPGLNGMSPLFFQKFWHVVKHDVVNAICSFLTSGRLLRKACFTHVVLIPKVNQPHEMSQLCPIGLCNVIYKIGAKVIANRLKKFLNVIISPHQSAFVLGMLISDNTLVAAEIGHFLHNKRWGREGSFALKLDISKAYDRVEWNFLEAVMLRLGFDSRWVAVVMMCVKSVSYYFLVNGEECLSALIAHKEEKGVISGIRICDGALSVHHLLFADDSFLFGKVKLEECVEVQHNLDVFSQASGQEINLGKSSIAFSANVRDRKQQGLAHFLGVQLLMARFWWGNDPDSSKIHWKSWDKLCLAKPEWGMRFMNLYAFNLAVLAKQKWHILQDPESLTTRLFKAKYHPHLSFWDASFPSSSSYYWSSILKARIVLEKGSRWLPPSRENMLVQELIDEERRMWCETALSAYFEEEDREHIRALPISHCLPPDKLVWHYIDKGQFTVKSAHGVAWDYVQPPFLSASSSSTLGVKSQKWWCMFLRIVHLPELHGLQPHERNDRIWKGKHGSPAVVAQSAVSLLQKFRVAAELNKVGGAEVVLRDEQGHFLAATTYFLPTVTSALQAEMLAIKRGVELTHQLGFQKVLIRSDSSQAISIILTCVDRASTMDLLEGDVLHITEAFIASKFIFVSRNNNSIAHCLAKFALSVKEPPSVIQDLLIHDIL
ncbi:hypothetical protein ACFX15_018211 [Malus domestica]